ncbi:MAG: hypothetical protein AAF420_07230 [Pseudomonadota bacterium]
MKKFSYLGLALLLLGLVILIGQIVTGEVCDRRGQNCVSMSENPEAYWKGFFIGPAFSIALGISFYRNAKNHVHPFDYGVAEFIRFAVMVIPFVLLGFLIGNMLAPS